MFQDTVGVEDSEIMTRIDRNYLRSRLLRYNGSDEDGEKLAARARKTEFLDADDQPLSEDEQENLRNLCAGFSRIIHTTGIIIISRFPGNTFNKSSGVLGIEIGRESQREIVEADSSVWMNSRSWM